MKAQGHEAAQLVSGLQAGPFWGAGGGSRGQVAGPLVQSKWGHYLGTLGNHERFYTEKEQSQVWVWEHKH